MKRLSYMTLLLITAMTAGLGAAGCDEPPDVPPDLLEEQPTTAPEHAVPPRPTTQELLEGPRHGVPLGELPLSVRAPQGWGIETMEGTTHVLLQGPTPSGEAEIQLNDRGVTSAAKFEMIVNGAKKEQQQSPDSIRMVELRTTDDGLKVLERQRVGTMPQPSPDDPPGTKPSPPLNWTITVFAPRGDDYDTYELNFIGLTAAQYEADQALLREIIESIRPETAAVDNRAGATNASARRS